MICFPSSKPNSVVTSYPLYHDHYQPKNLKIFKRYNTAAKTQTFSLPIINKSKNNSLKLLIVPMVNNSNESLILTSGAKGRINVLFSLRSLRNLCILINAFFLILLLPFRGRRRCVSAVPDSGPRKRVEKEVSVRRTLAIKRLVEDNNDKDTVREFSLFSMPRGDTIFTQSWTPIKLQVRGLVVLLHGLNEHSSRYNDFAKKLNANGFKVYGMDWIGHGGSDGLHAYVHSLDHAVNDMKMFISKVLAENPGVPCFCFGHSTGGAIVLKAMLDPKVSQRIAGIVLTSPAVGVQPSHPIFMVLAPVFSFLLPRFQFSAANKRGIAVSRDPEALIAKYSDPLVFTGSIRIRTGYEILRVSAYLQQNLRRVTVPFLVLHGTDDSVTDPEASRKLHDEASSTDKTIKLYQGFLHDLLFEPEKDEIVESIIEWLVRRL